jgi:hypothetical protein
MAHASCLHFFLLSCSPSHILPVGDVIIINNYIAQPVLDGNVAVICLDVSVTGTSHSVIGNPSEYKLQPTSCVMIRNPDFIGVSSDDFCDLCNGTPCDWSLYGQSIVDSGQGTTTTSPSTDLSSIISLADLQLTKCIPVLNRGILVRVTVPYCLSVLRITS